MTAYVFVDIQVIDPQLYGEYRQLAPESIELYGGKYLARGGKTETLEGDWSPNRIALLEFPTLEQAMAWHESPEYAPILAMRLKSTNSKMIVVEGLS